MILILFFVAFAILIYLFVSTHRTVVVYQESEPSWWPWAITSYNWWPYWNYGTSSGGSYVSSHRGGVVHHKGPRHPPHQESRPWGGASRHANASAPSKGYGGHDGPSGGHGGRPSGSHGGPSGGSSGGHGGGGHR